ncbi:hypothetical protein Dsin_018775 [Dipteronia sinensis]|uniref:Reverse transcriptase zinc-binding domain-containing protein n=1 Tax=Dipteronia sinensis TaxID=43782 RepID=A0AAE0A6T1_9ROSI|nr:hypothetical protein Dsin_018775 [Dipteronia sinensis]
MVSSSYVFAFLLARYVPHLNRPAASWCLNEEFRLRFPDIYFRNEKVSISLIKDTLVWRESKEGVVTCKHAYFGSLSTHPDVTWWKFFWMSFVAPSISTLLWLLWYNHLPTEDNLCKAGFSLTSWCGLCGNFMETTSHLFIFCDYASTLWKVVCRAFNCNVLTANLMDFLCQAFELSFSPHLGLLWLASIQAIVWTIWNSRNGLIFYNWGANIHKSLVFIWHSVREANSLSNGVMENKVDDLLTLKAFGLVGCPPKAHCIIPVIWSPPLPLPRWFKVNTDGASLGAPSDGGCGGVFMTCWPFLKGCFSILLKHVFAFEAELWAVIHDIEYAWKFNWHHLLLE